MVFSLFLIVISPYTALLPMILVTYKLITGRLTVQWNPWNLGLIGLFLWSIIAGILNYSLISTLLSAVIFMYFCLSVYLQNYYDDENKIEVLLKYLVYFSIFSAILGVIERITFMNFKCTLWKRYLELVTDSVANHRIYSTFGNPNVAGAWFAVMILISAYLSGRAKGNRKLIYNGSIILFILALYLTGSRGAEIGLLFGLIVGYLFKRHKKNVWIFISIIILISFFAFTPFEIFNIKNLMYRGISDSFSDRYGIWEGCINMIKQKPFSGWGLAGIYENSLNFINGHMRKYHGHNLWISLITTLGSIGLIIYLYMKLYLYKGIKQLYNKNHRLVPLLIGIQAVILGQGLVDFTIMTPQCGLIFISSSALVFSLNNKYNNYFPRETGTKQKLKIRNNIFN